MIGSQHRCPFALVRVTEPLRTDFTGYEGKYVAIDARTGEVVLTDEDPQVVLEPAKKLDHVPFRGRVPYPSEPHYVCLG